jgi:sigma-B regulation protein RsbU (phosphoserine phosphatase)
MATARAHLIAGAAGHAGGAALIGAVNRFLAQDIQDTGWFITLFWLEIDPTRRRLRWIRAGHEPALFYDPQRDDFSRLDGEGLALGIDPGHRYREYEKQGWTAGSILLISTDGVYETRNPDGRMFGLEPLQDLVRSHREGSAGAIRDAILQAIETYRQDGEREDDATLVVLKLP